MKSPQKRFLWASDPILTPISLLQFSLDTYARVYLRGAGRTSVVPLMQHFTSVHASQFPQLLVVTLKAAFDLIADLAAAIESILRTSLERRTRAAVSPSRTINRTGAKE